MAGRPRKEFDKKEFMNLVGLGCTQEEIAWWFRDDTGKKANIDTISRWCKRTFGLNFQEYYKKNGGMAMKIALRKNQMKLSEKNAAMAIFLGKNYLGQKDTLDNKADENGMLAQLIDGLKDPEKKEEGDNHVDTVKG